MRGDSLTEDEIADTLRFAVIFLQSPDADISTLGYRMILQYTSVTGDYIPLRTLAQELDLTPIVETIDQIDPETPTASTLSEALQSAHRTNFLTIASDQRRIYRTKGQMKLRAFNEAQRQFVVVAPTSYGKSEMLLERIAANLDGATAIVVPSKALIAQTRTMLIEDKTVRESLVRIITHPDAYAGESSFIAVLTQERLLRLLSRHPQLAFQQLLIDEAHELLPNEPRSVLLSQVILAARSRSSDLQVGYYTPFMANPEGIRHVNEADQDAQVASVREQVKVERLIYAPLGETQELYDQFLNRMIPLEVETPAESLDAIRYLCGFRTLVYVNRPQHSEHLAIRLSGQAQSEEVPSKRETAAKAISDLIDKEYALVNCVRSGVLFHHGQVPELVRSYVENLFRDIGDDSSWILVTTSTLLAGVNTPADRLIMLAAERGRRYLSASAFHNLIGRVARFSEIFAEDVSDLDLLQPEIYLVPGIYGRTNWDVKGYLERVANLSKSFKDEIDNPLLEDAAESEDRRNALEYLENVEPNSSGLSDARTASTEVGRLCFQNGIHHFDIFEQESLIQGRIDQLKLRPKIESPFTLIETISEVFWTGTEVEAPELERIRENEGARSFYAMFLDWRTRNESYRQMIAHFLRYWDELGDDLVYVGSRWGERTIDGESGPKNYVSMSEKRRGERVGLAVVKIKEEQDFVDNWLIGYVEILRELDVLANDLYWGIRFGTTDPYLICLLKNGFSTELARLVQKDYAELVTVDVARNVVQLSLDLAERMDTNEENPILVYEALTLGARVFD